ncbi:hypothetical protein ERJ75_001334800 [Trypanosoma vivax]|nr:hypothetical protein ERJ75_001334800 [Trypanosoma vivax]
MGHFLRRQLLDRLLNTPQLVVPEGEEVIRESGMWRSKGKVQTVLEGRRAIYPHDECVLEVVTTDRSRLCRYVRANELVCTLHYYVTPPPVGAAAAASLTPHASAATAEVPEGSSNRLFSSLPATSRQQEEGEDAYFTAVFDDGVVFTCSNRWPPRTQPPMSPSFLERELNNSPTSLSKRPPRRRTVTNGSSIPPSARRSSRVGASIGDFNSKRRFIRRGRGKNCVSEEVAEPANEQDDLEQPFPVDSEGSVLLWTAATKSVKDLDAFAASTAFRGIPSLGITVATGSLSVHKEEHDSFIWVTRHDSTQHPMPELLRCVHSMQDVLELSKSMEVEVRRVVLQDTGAVCRYFHSGASQMLYADGAVVTRYPVPHCYGKRTVGDKKKLMVETVLTRTGMYAAREINGELAGEFRVVAHEEETATTYDRGNHCSVMSRSDGVLVVRYMKFLRDRNACGGNGGDSSTASSREGQAAGVIPSQECDLFSGVHNDDVLACVTLHADGTCITTLPNKLDKSLPIVFPSPLVSFFEHVAMVESSCDAPVWCCVEAPSLPRIFLCTQYDPAEEDNAASTLNPPNSQQCQHLKRQRHRMGPLNVPGDQSNLFSWGTLDETLSTKGSTPRFFEGLMGTQQGVLGQPDTPPVAANKSRDRFYILFGDSTVLRRRVIRRGMRGTVTPFLETLLTRGSETSLRVIHDSGIVVAEPAEAARQNKSELWSAAVRQGFAVFDVALGGLQLVDQKLHLTEVQHLYSPCGVRAEIKPSTLKQLLRQLVLPMYTPHKVKEERLQAMRREALEAESEDRRNRMNGRCPPLKNRLRELTEEFVITNRLLSTDVLNAVGQRLEKHCSGRKTHSVSHSDAGISAPSLCASAHAVSMVNTDSKTHRQTCSVNSDGVNVHSRMLPETCMRMGVAPLFFSEFESGAVVQYLHDRDIDEFVRERGSEAAPVFLSLSTATGEPGVQQLTFLRLKHVTSGDDAFGKTFVESVKCATGDVPLGVSGFKTFSSTLLRRVGAVRECTIGGGSMVTGSKLGEAVQRQKQLALFAGGTVDYLTSNWLPSALQPPRRFLKYRSSMCKGVVDAKLSNAKGIVVVDEPSFSESGSSCERLRVFLKFSQVTGIARLVLLQEECNRHLQLTSLIPYNKAMQSLSIPHVGMTLTTEESEAEKLRETPSCLHISSRETVEY